ncbi:CACT-like protein [Mya arenaria]|uniref:CACT-like protein n=1 Tax=Mya arenaria TaxID=6604 RepID=A0ABY7F9I3_MYAAR|nr:CACT-like protein [Mya arenaria]
MDNRELETDDIETDCEPMSEPEHITALKGKDGVAHRFAKDAMEDCEARFDSRFSSGYKSFDSIPSGDLPSVINEGRSCDDEGMIPVSTLKSLEDLKITADASKTFNNASNLPSNDEGFVSQELKSGDILMCTGDNETSVCKSENDDKERIELYFRFVDENFEQDDDGDTRLHTAIIQLLEGYALNILRWTPCHSFLNIRNNFLQTPLHLTAITRQPNLARKLVTSGAQIERRDHRGNTALHVASKEGYTDVAAVLLEPVTYEETRENMAGIPFQQIPQNLEARNYDGQVCVHLAAEGGHIDTLNLLLVKGADVNCRDGKSGRTVLHYAAESGHEPLFQYLLSVTSVDINCRTYGRLTPIMLARGRGHTALVRLLKERGATDDSVESEEEEMKEEPDDYKIAGNPVN